MFSNRCTDEQHRPCCEGESGVREEEVELALDTRETRGVAGGETDTKALPGIFE